MTSLLLLRVLYMDYYWQDLNSTCCEMQKRVMKHIQSAQNEQLTGIGIWHPFVNLHD